MKDKAYKRAITPTLIALGVVAFQGNTLAQNECGPATPGGTVVCDTATYTTGPDDAITYSDVDGLTLEADGITVESLTQTNDQAIRVRSNNSANTGDINVRATDVNLTTGDENNIGDESIPGAPGRFSDGIRAEQRGQGATTASLTSTEDGESVVVTYGYNASGVYAWERDRDRNNTADVAAEFAGENSRISTFGQFSHGVFGRTDTGIGDVVVRAKEGTIETNRRRSRGVLARNTNRSETGAGDILIEVSDGLTVTTNGARSEGVLAEQDSDGNAIAVISDSSITTTSTNDTENEGGAHGVIVKTEGSGNSTIDLSNSTVSTAGDNSEGLFALAAGGGDAMATVDGDETEIITTGENSDGIVAQADDGSLFSITNGSAEVMLEGGMIATSGNGSSGIVAQTDLGIGASSGSATVVMNGGSISTSGGEISGDGIVALQGSHGILALGTGSGEASITQNDGSVSTSGDGSHSLYAVSLYQFNPSYGDGEGNDDGGDINVGDVDTNTPTEVNQNGGTAQTSGDAAHGVYALSFTGKTTVNQSEGGSINATGAGSNGMTAGGQDGVEITVSGSVSGGRSGGTNTFTGEGAQGVAIHAISGAPGQVTPPEEEEPNVPGFEPNNGDVNITITDTGSVGALSDRAILVDGGTASITNDGTVTGTIQTWDNDDTFTNNSSNSLNLRNFSDAIGADGIRDTEAVALNDFGAGNDIYTNAANGTMRLLTVEDQSGFSAGTDDDTAPIAWDTTGQYTPTGNVGRSIEESGVEQAHLFNLERFENAGLITMADAETGGTGPVAGDVIVITASGTPGTAGDGVYVSNGGSLHLDTVLNDGGTDDTDVLVVDQGEVGTSSTRLRITNALTGSGASTDTNGDGVFNNDEGILVVQALKEGSTEDTFVLDNLLIDGAWEYFLDQTDNQSWYLQSQLSAATSLYETYPQHLLGLIQMPNLKSRVGDRHWLDIECEATPEEDQACERNNGMWFRVDGIQADRIPDESTTGSEYDQDIWKVQTGVELALHEGTNGSKVIAGVTGQYQKATTNITSGFGNGEIDGTGFGVGGTLTWYSGNGFYADAQGAINWLDSDISSDTLGGLVGGNDATGYGLSLEIGKEIATGGSWYFTPQAQLSYTSVDFDDFEDPYGAMVSLDEGENMALRLGIAAEQDKFWEDEEGREERVNMFARLNLYHNLTDETQVDVSGTKLISNPEGWNGEIDFGVDRSFDDGAYDLYARGFVGTSIGNFGDNFTYGGSIGLRLNW